MSQQTPNYPFEHIAEEAEAVAYRVKPAEVKRLWEAGESVVDISVILHTSYQTVYVILRRYRDKGELTRPIRTVPHYG